MFMTSGLLYAWILNMSFVLSSSYLLVLPVEHAILDGCGSNLLSSAGANYDAMNILLML